MRRTAFLILPCLVACGDNLASPDVPDAAPVEPTPDADIPVDAPPTPGPGSRVWILGGIFDQRWHAGSFVESNVDVPAFPFTAANPPPVTAPDKGWILQWQVPFSASHDRIAYAAPAGPTAGTIHLWSANIDGSDPVVVARSIGARPWFLSNAISPDGRKVAFMADYDRPGRYDLYVAGTQGVGEPVRISPPRPATATNPDALDVSIHIAWSPDSRYVAFTGDLTDDGVEQAYLVDVTVESPSPVELVTRAEVTAPAAPRGAIGAPLFDSTNRVYFRARLGLDVELFRALPDGTRIGVPRPRRDDRSPSQAGPFTVHDKTLYAAFDATANQFDLFAIPFAGDGFGTPVNLTNTTTFGGEIDGFSPIVVAPDGSGVAIVANYDTPGLAWEPYVVATNKSGVRRLVDTLATCLDCLEPRVTRMQWTADSSGIYLVGDLVERTAEIFRVDARLTDQQPRLVLARPTPTSLARTVIVQPL